MNILSDNELYELLYNANWDWENQNNYQHTHYRCRYHPESHTISAEEVCINEYGSYYGRNVWCVVDVPKDRTVNWDMNWTDLEA